METLPLDLVVEIAWALTATPDIRNFRLVSKAFAYAASPVLFQRFQAINTLGCLGRLYEFQTDFPNSASTARHLTLHHGDWPQLESLNAWKTHPQALSHVDLSKRGEMQAYTAYRRFIGHEVARSFELDVSVLTKILENFPSLASLTISHIHTWRSRKLRDNYYDRLCHVVRVIPFWKPSVEDITSRLLPILSHFPQITKLSVSGALDAERLKRLVRNQSILSLHVSNLVVRGDKHDEVRNFLQSFPNLEELILGTESGGQISEQRIALKSLQWPNLRRVHFRHLWTSEDELMDFIERHPIQQIALRNITLFSGSWESFRRRIQAMLTRPLHSVTCITVGGIEIAFDKAVTSHPGWPGSVCALKPRVYLLLSGINGKQEQKFWRVAYNGKKSSVLFPY
jgi:hypothetical protein